MAMPPASDAISSAQSPLAFRKMHGLGNDFVIIDTRAPGHRMQPPRLAPPQLARIADRRLGIGCDQLILLEASAKADARMRIFNPDGGEVGACGNATRCVGWLLALEKRADGAVIETMAGLLHARLDGDQVTVDMGLPRLGWQEIPLEIPLAGQKSAATGEDTSRVPLDVSGIDPRLPGWFSAVNMGNPHAVFFVEEGGAFDLARIGPLLETHAMFPQKANISLASPKGANAFNVRVWERAAGITLACGTAACAVAVAAARLGMAGGDIRITLPGGPLTIGRDARGHVLMTGPVATSFSGVIDPSLLAMAEHLSEAAE